MPHPTAAPILVALLGALALGSGCDASESGPSQPAADPELVAQGQQVFSQPVADGNTFACATCHAITEPADDGIRRVGHPLFDATGRPTYKNGALVQMRDAVNSCLQEWMNAEPWSEQDERWLALYEFLDAQGPAEASPPLSFEVVPPPSAEALTGGEATSGRTLFDRSCSACHGLGGEGTQLAPPIARRGLDPEYVAQRVRTSGRTDSGVYDGLTGGVMPFWAADRLSDEELLDLVAWLALEAPPVDPVDPTDPTDPTGPGSDCPTTHPLVGATAVLEEAFHDVGGVAEVIDDCTIEIREFTFDGEGIDVRLYGGLAGNYDDGFAMGDSLIRAGGWQGETVRFTLPDDQTLDDLDGVSVWCVPVGVDFGSGMFEQ
ncbi:MAG: DM13 domain-containing protein [Nannocystaceae bacterium]